MRARATALAAALTLAQVALVFAFTEENPAVEATYPTVILPPWWLESPPDYSGWVGRLRRFNNWDSFHYLSIAERGYQESGVQPTNAWVIYAYRDNEGFFPGYPLVARATSFLTRLPPDLGLVMGAQLAAFATWLAFILLIGGARTVPLALAATFPPAFYLVVGYSESVFSASLLGSIFSYERARSLAPSGDRRRMAAWLALACGLAAWASATRFLGVLVAAYPIARELAEAWRVRSCRSVGWAPSGLVAAAALLGPLAYFSFLQVRFGNWRLYFDLLWIGWGYGFDALALARPSAWWPRFGEADWAHLVSQLSVPVAGLALAGWAAALVRRSLRSSDASPETPVGWGLWAVGAALFATSAGAKAGQGMDGMIRYLLPVWLLALVAWARSAGAWTRPRPATVATLAALVAAGLVVQVLFIRRYLAGDWVS